MLENEEQKYVQTKYLMAPISYESNFGFRLIRNKRKNSFLLDETPCTVWLILFFFNFRNRIRVNSENWQLMDSLLNGKKIFLELFVCKSELNFARKSRNFLKNHKKIPEKNIANVW